MTTKSIAHVSGWYLQDQGVSAKGWAKAKLWTRLKYPGTWSRRLWVMSNGERVTWFKEESHAIRFRELYPEVAEWAERYVMTRAGED